MINKHIIDMSIFVKECSVINIYHRDALKVWDQIKVGVNLTLKKHSLNGDSDGIVDAKVIDLEYEYNSGDGNKEKIKCIIGELSETDSTFIVDILNMGWDKVFSAYISYKDDNNPSENNKLKVVIYIEETPNN